MRRAELSWQTRALATFIANTIESDKAREQMVEMATKLSLLDDEDEDESFDGVKRVDTSGDQRSLEEVMEHGNVEEALKRNMARKGPGLVEAMSGPPR